jgi:hypothetical protein
LVRSAATSCQVEAEPWPVFHCQTIYIIPAILGAIAVLVVAVDLAKIGRARQ